MPTKENIFKLFMPLECMLEVMIRCLISKCVCLVHSSNSPRSRRKFCAPRFPAPVNILTLASRKVVYCDLDGSRSHSARGRTTIGYKLDFALFSIKGPHEIWLIRI